MTEGRINGLALCSGIGGLEVGLRIAIGDAYRCVCYVERDSYAASTIVARMEDKALDQAPIWDDVATFNGMPWRGCVDLISVGDPCQPHSSASRGRRVATDLWQHIEPIIEEVNPTVVFVENVKHRGHVHASLSALGYSIAEDCFAAADVGAPHVRRRAFTLGCHPNNQGQPDLRINAEVARVPELRNAEGGAWNRHANNLRMVDGAAHGVDRLRAIGNSVVPLVAAHAFRTLLARQEAGQE